MKPIFTQKQILQLTGEIQRVLSNMPNDSYSLQLQNLNAQLILQAAAVSKNMVKPCKMTAMET